MNNIVNPNKELTVNVEYFKIAVALKTTPDEYVMYNSQAAVVKTYDAPNWLQVYKVKTSTVYSRLETNYFFDFQVYNKIPSNLKNGAILIDFPREFAF